MDYKTIAAYDKSAKEIALLHEKLIPKTIYQLIKKYFVESCSCIDIGCGTGRDCHWLAQQGYLVTGIDASQGMLTEARKRYPNLNFSHDSLPLLETISSNSYHNMLCSAVLMHLKAEQIEIAVNNLLRIMKIDGIILISFRGTKNESNREKNKLYTPISPYKITNAFSDFGAIKIHYSVENEAARNLTWHNMVFKKVQLLEV